MAFTNRGRRQAYDNISQGEATGREQTIAGETVSVVEMPGGGYRTSTSTGDAAVATAHTNVAVGASVSDAVAGDADGGTLGERLQAGVTNTIELLTP